MELRYHKLASRNPRFSSALAIAIAITAASFAWSDEPSPSANAHDLLGAISKYMAQNSSWRSSGIAIADGTR